MPSVQILRMLGTTWSHVALAVSVLCATSSQVRAQRGLTRPSGGERVIELSSRERWLHEREQPALTPYVAIQAAVFIDSTRVDDLGRRTYHLTVSNVRASGDRGRIVVAADGRTLVTESSLRAITPSPYLPDEDDGGVRRYLLLVGNDGVLLPAAKLCDLVPVATPGGAAQRPAVCSDHRICA